MSKKKEKTPEEREKKFFNSFDFFDDEDEDRHADTPSGTSDGTLEMDLSSVNSKKDRDTQHGKVLAGISTTTSLPFFEHKILMKQDTHECGGHLWRSATVLMSFMENTTHFPPQEDGKSHWYKKRIIELGAGTGLLGIALAKTGASVIVTDQESLVPLMRENATLNQLSETDVTVDKLSWGEEDCTRYKTEKIDYIIASDCVYLEFTFEALIETMMDLADASTTIIMSFQKRRKGDNRFWRMAGKKFEIKRIPLESYSNSHERVMINFLTKK
ncbi:hypothetical protein PROFUN_08142 [Planoprotostelium fungivorum]|uniref:Uncharacterized protein n=1 Tax=Planoprotostelium fungivorum TaxID=1890364 RepID=A0A2P6MQG4_9EUKA|nr:hypothetical protein PROFUN_08142 [Planoprotostelium fungivorum]